MAKANVLEPHEAEPHTAGFVTHVAWLALAALTVVAVSAPIWRLAATVMGA